MIGTIIDLVMGPLGAVLGAIVGGLSLYLAGRASGKKGAQNEVLRDVRDRIEDGRDRLRDNRDSDPSERLRDNDGQW